MITADSGIRTQEANRLFTSIAGNAAALPIAMDFVSKRWNDIDEQYI